MKSPLIHAVLLVLALGVGYQTWTREKVKDPKTGEIEIWTKDPSSFESLALTRKSTSDIRIVRVEQREENGSDSYLWGKVIRIRTTQPAAKPKNAKKGGNGGGGGGGKGNGGGGGGGGRGKEKSDPSSSGLPDEIESGADNSPITVEKDFPVGESGDELVKNIARFRALEKVDSPTEEQLKTYGLAESQNILHIEFAGEPPAKFTVGNKVFGGADIYVLSPDEKTVYVLAGKVVGSLNGAENSLQMRKFHNYEDDDVVSVDVTTKAGSKALIKGQTKVDQGTKTTWAYSTSSSEPDPTLGNFLGRFKRLRPSGYKVELDEKLLTRVARLEFKGTGEKTLGFVELAFGKEDASAGNGEKADGNPQYYMRTERTHAYGLADRLTAEQIHQDVTEFFGGPPVPEFKAPKKPETSKTPQPPASHGGHGH